MAGTKQILGPCGRIPKEGTSVVVTATTQVKASDTTAPPVKMDGNAITMAASTSSADGYMSKEQAAALTAATSAITALQSGKVDTTDPRLSDARTPTAHTHPISGVTGLQTALDAKAALSHSHAIGDVTGLQAALDALTARIAALEAIKPLYASATVALPLIALGGTHSFTVNVPGATVGMAALVNPPSSLLANLAQFDAAVTAASTVTVRLKSGLAISAGNQTFGVYVIRS